MEISIKKQCRLAVGTHLVEVLRLDLEGGDGIVGLVVASGHNRNDSCEDQRENEEGVHSKVE